MNAVGHINSQFRIYTSRGHRCSIHPEINSTPGPERAHSLKSSWPEVNKGGKHDRNQSPQIASNSLAYKFSKLRYLIKGLQQCSCPSQALPVLTLAIDLRHGFFFIFSAIWGQ